MVEKLQLAKEAEMRLVLPASGFSQAFVQDVTSILGKFPVVERAYMALKRIKGVDKEPTLLLGLVLNAERPEGGEAEMDKIATAVMRLFGPKVSVDFLLLNSLPKVEASLVGLGAQVYPRTSG